MSNINMSEYLLVFNHVLTKGIKQQEKYRLGDLSVWHDFDGYTCYIGYKDLTMSLYFHSRYFYDYEEKDTLSAFKLLIARTATEIK